MHQLEKQEGKTRGKSDGETPQVEPPPGQSECLSGDGLIMTTPKTFPECVHVARWWRRTKTFASSARTSRKNVNHQLCQNLSSCKTLWSMCEGLWSSINKRGRTLAFGGTSVLDWLNCQRKSATRRVAMRINASCLVTSRDKTASVFCFLTTQSQKARWSRETQDALELIRMPFLNWQMKLRKLFWQPRQWKRCNRIRTVHQVCDVIGEGKHTCYWAHIAWIGLSTGCRIFSIFRKIYWTRNGYW